ncbi:peptidase U35 [Sinorhizobium meliloti]|uniref:peptidase U35 n=1 Tax=Rhizobium meliloti TaxID=382 RepID=UPI0039A6C85C
MDRLSSIERSLSELKHLTVALERRGRKRAKGPQEAVVRACVCRTVAYIQKSTPDQVATRLYPSDADVGRALADLGGFISTRAPAPPMTTDDVPQPGVGGILQVLAPRSAYSQLAVRGMRISLSGVTSVPLPGRDDAEPTMAGTFPAEGEPIPVRRLGLTSTVVRPYLAKVLCIFSAELAKHTENFERVLQAIITEDTAAAIDTAMLSNAAATPASPAGLLNGVTAIPATTGGGLAALSRDLGALAAAVDADDLVYLMTPAERIRALTLAPGLAAATIIETTGLPAGTIVGLDAASFVSGESDAPMFDLSDKAIVVADDGLPVPDFGTASTVSLWQQRLIGLRLLQSVTWGLRSAAGSIAAIGGVTW